MPGGYQLILIALLAVLLFGRGKISGMMEDVALGIKSFKKGMADDEPEIASSDKSTVIDHDADEKVGTSTMNEKSKSS